MSSAKDTDVEAQSHAAAESPGRMIARAREAASISPADLAVRLRLDTRIVKALERDDFENLPAPMFVKGYIRSIAKELGADADTILSAYELQTSVEPPSLADFSSRAPEQVGINSTSIKVVTYGLMALLVVLIALWWRSNSTGGDRPAPVSDTTAADSAVPLPYTFDVVEHDDTSWRVAAPPDAPPAQLIEPGPENAAVTAASTMPSPATMHALSITTDSEAWVEIYDRQGERLYFGMARAGGAVELEGQNYYRLILGNTDSIVLTFDGEPVDLEPYSQQGVAQLELGEIDETGDPAQ